MKLTCDRCGKTLLLEEDVRYKARLEVFAAYDPMELTDEDLANDHQAEIRRLLDQLNRQDAKTVQDTVYRRMEFDLCPACRTALLKDPLGIRAED